MPAQQCPRCDTAAECVDLLPDPRRQPTLKVEEAARLLGIGRVSFYKAIEAGQLPGIRIGHRVVVPTAALLRMLELDERSAD